MATRRSRRPAIAPRRKRAWAREADSITVAAGGSAQFDLLTDFTALSGSRPYGGTVGRVKLTCAFDRTSTAADLDALWIAVGVFPSVIDTADTAPASNPNLDWMLWTKRFISEENTGSGSGPFWEFDIKAMRRMDELGMTPILCIEAQALLAGTLAFGASTLLLLP